MQKNNELIVDDFIRNRIALPFNTDSRLIAFEGPARSSKTAIAIQIFYYAVYESKTQGHVIGGRDMDAINDNILYADVIGLLVTHPNIKWCNRKTGGSYLQFFSPNGMKQIRLANYSDKASWKKVLGGSRGIILIDECNLANEDFVNECFSRQIAEDKPLTIMTLNGDDPTNFIYQNYINYCKIVDDYAPASTKAYMSEFQQQRANEKDATANKHGRKKGYYYCFCDMANNPIMTPDKLADARKLYPVGSYYYMTKILGERGVQGDLLFADYMKQTLLVDAWERNENGSFKNEFCEFTIGVDIGQNRAFNSFALVGFTRGYKKAVLLKLEAFQKVGFEEKTRRLWNFIRSFREECSTKHQLHNVENFPTIVYVDSAEQNYIADLRMQTFKVFPNVPVAGSWKATIKARVDMMIIGFSTGRIEFDVSCSEAYEAYRSAVRSKNENEVRQDKNEKINDIMDSFEYALTKNMKALMINGGKDYGTN